MRPIVNLIQSADHRIKLLAATIRPVSLRSTIAISHAPSQRPPNAPKEMLPVGPMPYIREALMAVKSTSSRSAMVFWLIHLISKSLNFRTDRKPLIGVRSITPQVNDRPELCTWTRSSSDTSSLECGGDAPAAEGRSANVLVRGAQATGAAQPPHGDGAAPPRRLLRTTRIQILGNLFRRLFGFLTETPRVTRSGAGQKRQHSFVAPGAGGDPPGNFKLAQ